MGLICRMGLLLLHSSCKALHVRRLKGEAARQRLETATAPRCRLNEVNVRKHVQWPFEHKLLITPTANLISWCRISGISHKAELLLMEFICSRTGTRTTCRTAPDHEARLEGLVLRPDHLKVLLWLENKNDTFLFFSTLSMKLQREYFLQQHILYDAQWLPSSSPHAGSSSTLAQRLKCSCHSLELATTPACLFPSWYGKTPLLSWWWW